MKKNNFTIFLLSIFLIGCSEAEKPQKYIFNSKDMDENIDKYTISNGLMDEIDCGLTSLLFTKEILNMIKLNREFSLDDMMESTPTTIELFKDKIVWSDLGQFTKINKNKIVIKGLKNETIDLNLVINENNIHFKFIDKELVCIFPFKKI